MQLQDALTVCSLAKGVQPPACSQLESNSGSSLGTTEAASGGRTLGIMPPAMMPSEIRFRVPLQRRSSQRHALRQRSLFIRTRPWRRCFSVIAQGLGCGARRLHCQFDRELRRSFVENFNWGFGLGFAHLMSSSTNLVDTSSLSRMTPGTSVIRISFSARSAAASCAGHGAERLSPRHLAGRQ